MAVRRWNHALEADVIVEVEVVFDRYSLGEIKVASIYRYPDGTAREGDSHRVALGPGSRRALPGIWDALFDEVLCVQQQMPKSLALRLCPEGMDGWEEKVATIVRLVSHELHVPIVR